MQSLIWYESLTERDYMYLLEIDPEVLAYSSQPLKISYKEDGKHRRYTPDFFIERSQKKQIVEIKPKTQINYEKNVRLFQCISYICQCKGWDFLVITDEMIRKEPILSNIKLLYRYALIPLNPQVTITCHQYFKNQLNVTLKTAENDLSSKGIFRETLLKLVFVGFLTFDLMTPIGSDSLISLSETSHYM